MSLLTLVNNTQGIKVFKALLWYLSREPMKDICTLKKQTNKQYYIDEQVRPNNPKD